MSPNPTSEPIHMSEGSYIIQDIATPICMTGYCLVSIALLQKQESSLTLSLLSFSPFLNFGGMVSFGERMRV